MNGEKNTKLNPNVKISLAEFQSLCVRFESLKQEMMTVGLFSSAQRMNYVSRMLGFEFANDIEGCLRYEKIQKELGCVV